VNAGSLIMILFRSCSIKFPTSENGEEHGCLRAFAYKQRSVEMFTLSATKRYLNLLEQKSKVIQFAPLKQIASYLGVTDTSLSRIRKELVSHPRKIKSCLMTS
jgi:hypothetical protein